LAHGAEGVDEVEKLKVKHKIKHDADFKAHVQDFENKGKRKEMGAKNMPFE
jgi:hypothetical protein